MNFEIKITGEGNLAEIANALFVLADEIDNSDPSEIIKRTYEDETLCCELTVE